VELNYRELIDQLIEAKASRDNSTWKEAAICFVLKNKLQVPAKTIGGDIGYSGRYISMLVKTFEAFPEEDSRAQDLTYSHHQVAAATSDPGFWIEQAVKNGWSVRDMQNAISGEDDSDPLEKAHKLWDRVLKEIDKGGPGAEYLRNQICDYV
jgi:hypothetical protein